MGKCGNCIWKQPKKTESNIDLLVKEMHGLKDFQTNESSDTKETNTFISAKAYDKPKWKNVNITVMFEDRKYNNDFLEYQTLEDLYSWIKMKLLTDNLFVSGSHLMLSSNKIDFPLKANTANKPINALPFFYFICSQITQPKTGSGFGDTNSRFDTRFDIPVDVRKLENLTPIQYLSEYCRVSETWKMFYWKIFSQNDLDRDGLLTYKQLEKAMEKLFVELAHPLLKKVLLLTGLDSSVEEKHSTGFNCADAHKEKWKEKLNVDKKSFVNLCALANRIICRETKIDGFSVESVKQPNTQLEDADFYNIEGKLQGCNLNPLTKRLLLYVKR